MSSVEDAWYERRIPSVECQVSKSFEFPPAVVQLAQPVGQAEAFAVGEGPGLVFAYGRAWGLRSGVRLSIRSGLRL